MSTQNSALHPAESRPLLGDGPGQLNSFSLNVAIFALLRLSNDDSLGCIQLNTNTEAVSADCEARFSSISRSSVADKNRIRVG